MSGLLFAIRARLRAVIGRSAVDREMREEMALHLEQATERLMARGLSEAEARDTARREFGNVALLQEEGRDARGGQWVESLAADARFAGRHFSRTPVTTVTLILVLALGIGVNSAIFSFMQLLTMRPPPGVPATDALVRVRGIARERSQGRLVERYFSGPELNAIAARREAFASVAGWAAERLVVEASEGDDPRVLPGEFVTPNYFSTLGVQPVTGPGLPVVRVDDAPGAELAAVISHRLRVELGGDTAVIGRIVRVNGIPVRIAGVAPPAFAGAIAGPDYHAALWLPLAARASLVRSTPYALVSRDSTLLRAVARLAPGTTIERASTVARVVAASWAPNDAATHLAGPAGEVNARGGAREQWSDVVPLRGDTEVGAEYGLAIVLVGAGALLVLLIACTNVSALLVGAGVARRREIAIRLSLGASRLRLVRQLVTESVLIALAGGALGLGIYWSFIRLLLWQFGDPGIAPDLGTVGFTALVALGTGIVFGLSPALHATHMDVSTALKSAGYGTTSRSRLQRAFIVAQIGLTQPLLIGLAMVVGVTKSELGSARAEDPLAVRVTSINFGAGGASNGAPNARQERVREFMDRVARLPDVEGVVPEPAGFDVPAVRVHPADRGGGGSRAEEVVRTQLEGTAPGYFAFQHIPMLRGRELVADDTAGRDMAVVIDNGLARAFWGTVDPIGKRLEVSSRQYPEGMTAMVVGVFDTARVPTRGTGRLYTAHGAHWRKDAYLIRTRGQGTGIIPTVRALAREAIPDIPIYRVMTLEQIARREQRDVMLVSASAAGGGLLAMLLASIGLYGVVALAVRQRHREIGIRVALGARPQQVIAMFFTNGLRLSVVGLLLGLPLSVAALYALVWSLARELSDNVWIVGAALVVAAVVIAVASLASWIPARRAAGVDPLVAIRVE